MKTMKRHLIILIMQAILVGNVVAQEKAALTSWNGTQTSGTYTLDANTITLTAPVELTGELTLKTNDKNVTIKRGDFDGNMFTIKGKTETQTVYKLTITGTSANKVTIDGGAVFNTAGDATSGINEGVSQHTGRVISMGNYSALDLSYVVIQNAHNSFSSAGCAIWTNNNIDDLTDLKLTDCEIKGCMSESDGSAIHFGSARHDAKLLRTRIHHNYAKVGEGRLGSTIRTVGGTKSILLIQDCEIDHNKTEWHGGAVAWYGAGSSDAKLTVKGATKVHHNESGGSGGGFFISAIADIQSAEIYNNTATGLHGAEYNNTYSPGCGGGVYAFAYQFGTREYNGQGLRFTMSSNVSIHDNTAYKNGGGVFVDLVATNMLGFDKNNDPLTEEHAKCVVTIEDGSQLYNNKAAQGGGMYVNDQLPYRYLNPYNGSNGQSNWSPVLTRSVIIRGGRISGNTCAYQAVDGENYYGGGLVIHKHAIDDDYYTHYFSGVYSTTPDIYAVNTYNSQGAGTLTIDIEGGDVYDNEATNNYHTGYGGALYVYDAFTDKKSYCNVNIGGTVEIYNNSCDQNGGGILVQSDRTTGGGELKVHMTGGTIGKVNQPNKTLFGNGGGLFVSKGTILMEGGSISNNIAANYGGGIYFDASSTMKVGAGDMNISGNTVNSVPNNLYLSTNQTIEVVSGSFNPQYLGIYTEETATAENPIPVFTVSDAANYTYLEDIYDGMTTGTMNVVDDRQIHSAQYTSPQTTLYFGIGSPWSPLQQTARASDLGTTVNDFYEIGNVKQLTAFLWKVNGISTHETSFTTPVSNLKGKLIADIDMTGHYWMPFANYQGTFDGNGHTITGLVMVPTNASTGRGLFGTTAAGADIKNIALDDCQFYAPTSGSCYVGSIVSDLAAGTVSNSVVNPGTQLFATGNTSAILGGIAGQVSGGTLHSSIAMAEMTGYQMGGLVGQLTSGNLYNSFAYPMFNYSGSGYVGGLVGVNAGTVENCYARIQNATAPSNTYFGYLVGDNTSGTLNYSYAPANTYTASGKTGTQTGLSTFGFTSANAYDYRARDNQVAATNAYAPTYDAHHLADKQLKKYLNKWVDTKNGSSSTYAGWTRPTTQAINDDYPLLKLSGFNAVAATSGEVSLDYGDINSLLTSHATANNTILFYGSKAGVNSNSGSAAPLYIDEDAVLTQNGTIQAYVGVTLDNSACHNGANPTFGGGTVDYTDWHFFSSALTAAPIGIDYNNDNTEYKYNENSLLPKYPFTSADGYFPTGVYGDGSYATDYYPDWDLYAYYEPDYHWINFKRNGNSHWHEDLMPGEPEANRPKINYKSNGTGADYTNETNFIPGRGYMVALKEEGYLQAYGTLNSNTSSAQLQVPVTYTKDILWTTRDGQNLLGNPYQSYLDFDAFANDANNKTLWSSSTRPFYIIMDEAQADYVTYTKGQTPNEARAGRYLHPHQGFMIKVGSSGTAYFDNTMRSVTMDEGWSSSFRGGDQPNYALVNLFAQDANGNRDMVTVELGRPDKGGLLKSHVPGTSTGRLFCSYEGKNYDLAFTQPGLTEAAIRFTTKEDGEYTMTWNTQNGDFSYLHLIDNLTGTDIDCLTTDEYKFSALTSDYESRFRLVFDYTGIEENGEDDASAGSASFAFMMGDQLVVNGEGTLQLFDVTGRLLLTTEVNGVQTTMPKPNTGTGIYLLHLTGVNGSKTQKIVIP